VHQNHAARPPSLPFSNPCSSPSLCKQLLHIEDVPCLSYRPISLPPPQLAFLREQFLHIEDVASSPGGKLSSCGTSCSQPLDCAALKSHLCPPVHLTVGSEGAGGRG